MIFIYGKIRIRSTKLYYKLTMSGEKFTNMTIQPKHKSVNPIIDYLIIYMFAKVKLTIYSCILIKWQ